MIIKYLFCSRTSRFLKFYLVFIRSMQLKKKNLNKNSLLRGSTSLLRGLTSLLRGLDRVLLTTWVRTGYCGVHGRMAPLPSCTSYVLTSLFSLHSRKSSRLLYARKVSVFIYTKKNNQLQ